MIHKLERAVETRYVRFVIEEAEAGDDQYMGLQVRSQRQALSVRNLSTMWGCVSANENEAAVARCNLLQRQNLSWDSDLNL